MRKETLNTVIRRDLDDMENSNDQAMMMGSVLIGLNLVLMISVSLYWTNPSVHQYLSGRPL